MLIKYSLLQGNDHQTNSVHTTSAENSTHVTFKQYNELGSFNESDTVDITAILGEIAGSGVHRCNLHGNRSG